MELFYKLRSGDSKEAESHLNLSLKFEPDLNDRSLKIKFGLNQTEQMSFKISGTDQETSLVVA
jgi:hypothetical protein